MRQLRALSAGILVILLFTSVALAETYTFTTTAAQDDVIAQVVAAINAARAQEHPPRSALTAQEYLRSILLTHLMQWVLQRRQTVADQMLTVYPTLTATQKAQVCTMFRLAVCPP